MIHPPFLNLHRVSWYKRTSDTARYMADTCPKNSTTWYMSDTLDAWLIHVRYMFDTDFSLNISRIVWTLKDCSTIPVRKTWVHVSDRIRSYPIRIRQFWWMRERACIRSVSSVYWHVSNCIHTYRAFVSCLYRVCIGHVSCMYPNTHLYRIRHNFVQETTLFP